MDNAKRIKSTAMDCLFLLTGSFCFGASVSLFAAPNNIAPGGVSGLMTLVNVLWGLPIGTMTLLANIPLMLIAWVKLGRAFAGRTILGTVVSSLIMDMVNHLAQPFTSDRLLAAIFGGILAGLGLGLILSRGATTGGAEIIARLLERRWPHIPIGRLLLLLDGVVIALSALVYRQLESPLYAIVMVFIASLLIDRVITGGQKGVTVLIISQQQQTITNRILTEMQRGVTLLHATGAYTGADGTVILCALRRSELPTLKTLALAADPMAFILLMPADEVQGVGFRHGDHPPRFDKNRKMQ